jgi:hypothetical protein
MTQSWFEAELNQRTMSKSGLDGSAQDGLSTCKTHQFAARIDVGTMTRRCHGYCGVYRSREQRIL